MKIETCIDHGFNSLNRMKKKNYNFLKAYERDGSMALIV